MSDIPIHQLKERSSLGLEVWRYHAGEISGKGDVSGARQVLDAHRDDHYIFFLVDDGNASLMIDFNEVYFQPQTLYYILPGQVHHRIKNEMADGWFLAVDTMLVPPDYRKVFEGKLTLQKPYLLDDVQMKQCMDLLLLLQQRFLGHEDNTFNLSVVHSLLQSFIGIAAGCFAADTDTAVKLSRPVEISQLFKQLLVEHYMKVKSPSAYAGMLNVSETYLNEALKKTTGLSVSYWILNEVMLEAKRLLYYGGQNVKEIAHTLGYEDHAYFSRLFKKSQGLTPLSFRAEYRK
jgi:AraC family transcriptional activator of pobA